MWWGDVVERNTHVDGRAVGVLYYCTSSFPVATHYVQMHMLLLLQS